MTSKEKRDERKDDTYDMLKENNKQMEVKTNPKQNIPKYVESTLKNILSPSLPGICIHDTCHDPQMIYLVP